ncbi:MAG TPA: hypothetical protein VK528_09185 [Flavobacterium sp.]|nr:hypothetical protein [Flavobacterium sp.]
MDANLYQQIEKSTAHRPSRDFNANLIFENPELLGDLIHVALDTKDKNHDKACWILELVIEKNPDWLSPYLKIFCKALPDFIQEGAIRSVSKICWFAAMNHLRKLKSGENFLSEKQLKQLTEACFDWLIGDTKVAAKAYSMRALFEIGKLQDWIYPQMRSVLETGYPEHSPAYRAAAKDLLRKMK